MGKRWRSIQVDAEVWRLLQENAVPLEEAPNDVLRRLLGLDRGSSRSKATKKRVASSKARRQPESSRFGRSRRVKLDELIDAGFLEQGQKLYLCDDSGNIIPGYHAKVSGDRLYRAGKFSSMSGLARALLAEAGRARKSVRGPKHWKTPTGDRVVDLWVQYLENLER